MSAQYIFDTVPLGATIRFCDHTPRPPERFRRKLAAWNDRNASGTLIRKMAGTDRYPASIALHLGTYGSNGVTVLVVTRHFQVTSELDFEIVKLPAPGSVRVLTIIGDGEELRHLAPDLASAKAWLATNRYSNARFDVVPEAEQGRAA